MSKIRGIFPLFLATTFGVVNGIWVFGPAFKKQQQEKDELTKKALQIQNGAEEAEMKVLRQAEAEAGRTAVTESALRQSPIQKTWWPSLSLWSKPSTRDGEDNSTSPPVAKVDEPQKPDSFTEWCNITFKISDILEEPANFMSNFPSKSPHSYRSRANWGCVRLLAVMHGVQRVMGTVSFLFHLSQTIVGSRRTLWCKAVVDNYYKKLWSYFNCCKCEKE